MDRGELSAALEDIPREPGVYRFLDGERQPVYIGKAVDLRDRLTSYRQPPSRRIEAMLETADDIDFAVTDTETQALLLEANLIKRHQPRYNVRLTDDKSYPLIQLTDHRFPRIEVTRDPEEGATVFGPFTDRLRLDEAIKAIREQYGLRGCSDHKFANRDRPCLDYELGICAAPCTGLIDDTEYHEGVAAATRFFEGESGLLAQPVEDAMIEAAADRSYERAANLRDRLEAIRSLHGQHEEAIASKRIQRTVDVLGVSIRGDTATVARLHSDGGQLVERTRRRMAAPDIPTDRVGEVIAAFLTQYYAERPFPDVILVQELPTDDDVVDWLAGEGIDLRVPAAGREATLLDLALKNASTRVGTGGDPHTLLAHRLDIDRPRRIEGIDVSHAHGRAVVGSNVVFVDGSPETSHYRRKRLPDGNDDVDRISRLARWRAERSLAGSDSRPDPDLLLVDGGRAQLAGVEQVLDGIGWSVPVISLAKREETVITSNGPQDWPDDDAALHLLQRVRDEAHRFAVSYHQTVRDSVETVLDEIPGIGPERRRRLLRRFGSLDGVRSASLEELMDVPGVGEETARTLHSHL